MHVVHSLLHGRLWYGLNSAMAIGKQRSRYSRACAKGMCLVPGAFLFTRSDQLISIGNSLRQYTDGLVAFCRTTRSRHGSLAMNRVRALRRRVRCDCTTFYRIISNIGILLALICSQNLRKRYMDSVHHRCNFYPFLWHHILFQCRLDLRTHHIMYHSRTHLTCSPI